MSNVETSAVSRSCTVRTTGRLARHEAEDGVGLVRRQPLVDGIAEHRETPGILLDSTAALCAEADKVLEKLGEVDQMDVPRVLQLKVTRICDYLDHQSAFWSAVLGRLQDASSSDAGWRPTFIPSEKSVERLIEDGRSSVSDGPVLRATREQGRAEHHHRFGRDRA